MNLQPRHEFHRLQEFPQKDKTEIAFNISTHIDEFTTVS